MVIFSHFAPTSKVNSKANRTSFQTCLGLLGSISFNASPTICIKNKNLSKVLYFKAAVRLIFKNCFFT